MLDQPGKRNYYKSGPFQRMGETKKKKSTTNWYKTFWVSWISIFICTVKEKTPTAESKNGNLIILNKQLLINCNIHLWHILYHTSSIVCVNICLSFIYSRGDCTCCLDACWSRVSGSHRRNAERRLRGAGGQPACLRLEFLLLHLAVPPVPLPVCTTCGAQDHLGRASHLLSLRDLWPALHLTAVDHRAERGSRAEDVCLLRGTQADCCLSLPDLQLHQGEFKPRGRPLWIQVVLLWHLCECFILYVI